MAVSDLVDLRHSCGFITLVKKSETVNISHQSTPENGGRGEAANFQKRRIVNNKYVFGFGTSATSLSSESVSLANVSNRDPKPQPDCVNGNMDSERAKMLIDELETLEECKGVESATDENDGVRVDFDEWELMDCTFGIPLFNAKLNKEICERMCSYEVGKPKR